MQAYTVLSLLSKIAFCSLLRKYAGHKYLDGNHVVVTWQKKVKLTERAFKT